MGQRIYWLVGMNNQVRLGWQDVLHGQPCSGWPSPSPPQSPQIGLRGTPGVILECPSLKKAATYSPALRCSTIGAPGLNFSVRDGKRWNTGAKAT